MEIDVLKLSLNMETYFGISDAGKIRGYLGNLFWDNPHAHHHGEDGHLIYRYPIVQYKIIDGSCLLLGFKKGTEIVKRAFYDLKEINLNGKWEEVLSKGLESYITFFYLLPEQVTYSFLTPWLALNEQNYEKYQRLGSWGRKKELLEKILIGNIISMSKSLGYTVPSPIEANIHHLKEVKTSLKGTPMLGFLGDFSVNFEIPDYWGIGKSVSRGFGTIRRVGVGQ